MVIHIAMLAIVHPWEQLPLGGSIAFELVGDDPSWDVL
jgi:hypothetical protein